MKTELKTIVEAFDAQDREWAPHPKFAGVAMKHLLQKGAVPAGPGMSVHLVRVAAGCAIGEHVHEASAELHLVLAGAGEGLVEGRATPYAPGRAALIPGVRGTRCGRGRTWSSWQCSRPSWVERRPAPGAGAPRGYR